ncbi:MAG: hypothetical protein OHK0029_15670 [Armatimonadaceae bacterium]
MSAWSEYHFLTHWFAPGATLEEVFALLADVESLPHWWAAVYLAVTPVLDTTGDEGEDTTGIGREFDLQTRGWLPYTLRWRMTVREVHPPWGATIGAAGDFNGRGIWSFLPAEDGVDILFDWKLTAEKPLLKVLSPLLKPLFALNHQWAMAQGQISLLHELERRRTPQPAADTVPPPPVAPTWQPWAAIGAAAGVAAVLWLLLRRGTRG